MHDQITEVEDHVDNLWNDVRHDSIHIGLNQTCALNFECAHLLSFQCWRDFKGHAPPALPAQMQLQPPTSRCTYPNVFVSAHCSLTVRRCLK